MASPERKEVSPVPWYGCVILIIVGAIIWVGSAIYNIASIAELGRVLVYIPMGSLFGMSLPR